MADNFGLKIGIEGEKKFKIAFSNIDQSFKVLGSEMKLFNSQFNKNGRSVKSLTSRNEVRNGQIDLIVIKSVSSFAGNTEVRLAL